MMIKKLCVALLWLCFGLSATFAQAPVEITGLLKKKRNAVKLFKVAEGRLVEMANVVPNVDGKFGFLFYPTYEGLYALGTGTALSQTENYNFYFKAGDKLSLTLNDKNYTLTGKNTSEENLVLSQWHQLSDPLYQKSINFMSIQSTFVDFFPDLEAIVLQSKTFLKGKTTKNPKFNAQIKNIIAMDLANYAVNFLNTPRSKHPTVPEFSNFYSSLKAQKIGQTTSKVYGYPYGQRVLSSLIMVNMRQSQQTYKPNLEGMAKFISYVPNDTLKGDIVLDLMSMYKAYDEYRAAIGQFGQYLLTKAQQNRSEAIMSPLLTYKAGTDAFQFSYPDQNGNDVSLASLKNKVVLVDVWATWCGPCKQEIPHLKQLEKEVEGLPIQIVSLSTDDPKNKGKWLQMIKDEELGGLQLFAGGSGNEFSKYYKISTIPRFLVFDKNGKIVTVNAPRPSSPELKQLLLAEAAK